MFMAEPEGREPVFNPGAWELRLYVADKSTIEVIDLLVNPQLARGDQIVVPSNFGAEIAAN